MATTVGQHSVAAFTSPVNGTTPIDANSVRGNDNTMRSAYVDHDADTGIHVQSSTLAARPAAGTAGRKWITEDSGIYTLWFDDGVHWHPVSSEAVAITVLATENLVKGDVVKVVGWNNGQDLAEVAKTTSASDVAFAVITATVSSGVLGYATNTGVLQDINTNAYAVGTVLYPNASGGFTSTKPTSGNYQPVAYVLRQNTNNGVIYVEFSAPRIVERSDNTASTIVLRDSNGDFSAGTITATAVNATTLDLTNLEVTNIKAKDGTQAIAIADSTGALTVSGDLTVDTNTLYVDATNNRVGIGTASPAYALDAAGQTRTFGTPSAFSGLQYLATYTGQSPVALGQGSDATGYLINIANAGLAFGTNNTEKMRLDASGNLAVDTSTLYVDAANNRVGVGTATPAATLHVSTAGTSLAQLTGAEYSQIRHSDGTRVLYTQVYNNVGVIGTESNTPLAFNTNNTEKMRLDASGNLGIGTASPATALHTYASGTVISQVETGTQYAITRLKNPTHSSDIGVDNTSLYMDSGGAYPIIFYTGSVSTERMRLDANGNLGIGGSPSYKLHLVSGSAADIETGVTNSAGYSRFGTRSSGNSFVGAFTAGKALELWSAGSLNATLDASGNLGIGTASPAAKLDVSGYARLNGSGADVGLVLARSGTTYGQLTTSGTNILEVRDGSFVSRAVVDASGRLSVNTTSATGYLTVDTKAQFGLDIFRSDSSAQYSAIRFRDTTNANTYGQLGWDSTGLRLDGVAGTMYFSTSGTERARIDSSGNLIVGTTTTPSQKVGVSGSFIAADGGNVAGAGGGVYFAALDVGKAAMSGIKGVLANSAGGTEDQGGMAFLTRPVGATGQTLTERARITAGGFFKASDAGTYNDATGSYHELRNSANEPALAAHCTNASFTSGVLVLRTTQAAGTGFNFIAAQANLVDQFVVRGDGNVINTNGSYGTISDERLKQDIIDAPSQWDDLKAVRFRKYRMKTDVAADPNAPFMLGVVAQELEQTSPGLVDEHPDFEEQEVTDEDGNVTTERVQVGTTKSVKSSILLMKAAVALQEAMARIESLEARLAALES